MGTLEQIEPAYSRAIVSRIATRDPGAAEHLLGTAYGACMRADFDARAQGFRMQMTVADFASVTLVGAEASGYSCTRYTDDLVQVFIQSRGGLSLRNGKQRREIVTDFNAISVIPPWDSTVMTVLEGAGLILSLPMSKITARAEMLIGEAGSAPSRLELARGDELSSPMASALARNMRCALVEVIHLESQGLAAFAQSGYEELFLDLAVGALFPAVAHKLEHLPADSGSLAMRQARDYIIEHAAEPIDLLRLAQSLGISIRVMQRNFRKRFGVSAREFITERRLDLARQQLLSGNRAKSVAGVAFASGFGNLSHFVEKYRSRFGELPSETRRASLQ